MPRHTAFAIGLALPLMTQTALADLTPAQVWGDWQTYLETMGYEITATENASGNTLNVSDITLTFDVPEGEGDVTMTLGELAFQANGDGSVAVIMPTSMPITVSGTDSTSGEDFTATLAYAQTGHKMIASGSPEAVNYLYTAQSFAMTVEELTADGETLSADDFRVAVNGTNLQATTSMTLGEAREYEQTGVIDALSYDFFFKDPEGGGNQGEIKGALNRLTMNGSGIIPLEITDQADMAAMMRDGFEVDGTFTYADGSTTFDVKDPENGNFVAQTSSSEGSVKVEMGLSGLGYDVRQKGLDLSVTAEAMPFPIQLAMAESGFKLDLPVAKSDDPQSFGFGITLSDFTMSDLIWGIFDPAGQLPRDPATVLLDISGKVKLLVDWMNPEVAEQMTGQPGEVQAVDLLNLVVSAAGARLDGSGAVTFDGTGAPLIPNMGSPVGALNFALAGGNGLLDKLVAMGLVPQEDAMGARMMMGLFTVPGDAPDTLKSKIEFTQDGQILANGQRIR